MNDFLWYLLGFIVASIWFIYVFVTLPKIRENRTVYLSDWGFGLVKPFKTLLEYKELCKRDNEPLTWFKAQVFLLAAFLIVGTLWIIIGSILK